MSALAVILGIDPRAADWRSAALCAQSDPDAWFPGRDESAAAAKRICQRCPSRPECLEYALERHEAFGVWGGLSSRERRRLLRQREQEAA